MSNGFFDDCPDLNLPGGSLRRRRFKPEQAEPGDGLVYPRFTCRECGGDCPVYSSEGRVRRHKCVDCGHTFKTTEKIVQG